VERWALSPPGTCEECPQCLGGLRARRSTGSAANTGVP
jgi:hypothetical protein